MRLRRCAGANCRRWRVEPVLFGHNCPPGNESCTRAVAPCEPMRSAAAHPSMSRPEAARRHGGRQPHSLQRQSRRAGLLGPRSRGICLNFWHYGRSCPLSARIAGRITPSCGCRMGHRRAIHGAGRKWAGGARRHGRVVEQVAAAVACRGIAGGRLDRDRILRRWRIGLRQHRTGLPCRTAPDRRPACALRVHPVGRESQPVCGRPAPRRQLLF
jgi:hypothetical protein